MNIVMSYIDYNMASLEDREVFSATKTETTDIYRKLKENKDIYGAVLIATCNRTELYLSLRDNVEINPFEELCKALCIDHSNYEKMNKTLKGEEAIEHLCKVAAGAESQIWGEDQIISQVRDAITNARAHHASDTILNVVFRTGVSAGKKVKTLVDFKVHDDSTASRAVSLLKGRMDLKKVLVVGNGMIGRLVAELLVKEGKDVTMTLRQYKHGDNIVPAKVKTVNYSDRYEALNKMDAVISATLSPHYTLVREKIEKLNHKPIMYIDLAVPRDIEPSISKIPYVEYYNVDQISAAQRTAKQKEQMVQIEHIIKKYIDDFYSWYSYRENMLKEEVASVN